MLSEFHAQLPELTAWRHQLHRRPELAFEERETARFIAEKLAGFGLQPVTGIAETGIVAVIEGQEPGPSIGLRADMDALPIQELTALEYASCVENAAHACGHDGHVVTMLAVARHMAAHPPARGRLVMIFQPSEETAQGAARMLEEGLLERFPLDEIYAFHNMPLLPSGTAMALTGATLNGARAWEIEVQGTGGHGAAFFKTTDPLQAAARIAIEIPSIIGRYVDPAESALISVGKLQAGSALNVIPGRAALGGTLRAISRETMTELYSRLEQICRGAAVATGCTVTPKTLLDVPPCINAAGPAQAAARACAAILGDSKVIRDGKPLAFTDDFAHFLHEVPGAYIFLGQNGRMCHDPQYDFDDALLPVASSIMLGIVAEQLNGSNP